MHGRVEDLVTEISYGYLMHKMMRVITGGGRLEEYKWKMDMNDKKGSVTGTWQPKLGQGWGDSEVSRERMGKHGSTEEKWQIRQEAVFQLPCWS